MIVLIAPLTIIGMLALCVLMHTIRILERIRANPKADFIACIVLACGLAAVIAHQVRP